MKKHIIIISIILLLILLIGFNLFTINNKNPIMTIVYTDKHNKTHYLAYDLKEKSVKEIFNHENLGFSTGSISKDRKKLYFTNRNIDNRGGLYELSIENSKNIKEIHLPNLSIDVINIIDNKIYFRGLQMDDPYNKAFYIGTYDIKSREIDIWNKDEKDLSILNFTYNPATQKIYAIEISESERMEKDLPINKIVTFDKFGNQKTVLIELEIYIDNISISPDGRYALFSGSTFKPRSDIYMVDLKTSTVTTILESNDNTSVKWPSFSPDGKGFYYLAITPESKELIDMDGKTNIGTRGVYYYDFASSKTSKIWMSDTGTVKYINIQY